MEIHAIGFGKKTAGKQSIRLSLNEGTFDVNLGVPDLRLYEEDQQTPRLDLVRDLQRRIESGVDVIAGVGLTRPFARANDDAQRHWLQVNNVHLRDKPTWQLRQAPV